MKFQRSALVAALALIGAAASAQAATVSFTIVPDDAVINVGQTTIVHLYAQVVSNPGNGSVSATHLGFQSMNVGIDFATNDVISYTDFSYTPVAAWALTSDPVVMAGGNGDGIKLVGGGNGNAGNLTVNNTVAGLAPYKLGVAAQIEIGSFEVLGTTAGITSLNLFPNNTATTPVAYGVLYLAKPSATAGKIVVTSQSVDGTRIDSGDIVNITNASIQVVDVPEPASMALLAMGGLCLLGRKRA